MNTAITGDLSTAEDKWEASRQYLPDWAPRFPQDNQGEQLRKWDRDANAFVGVYRLVDFAQEPIIWHAERPEEVLAYWGQLTRYGWRYVVKPASRIIDALQNLKWASPFEAGHSGLVAFEDLMRDLVWDPLVERLYRRDDLRVFFDRLEAELKADRSIIFAHAARKFRRCWGIIRHAPAFDHLREKGPVALLTHPHQQQYVQLVEELGGQLFCHGAEALKPLREMEIYCYDRPRYGKNRQLLNYQVKCLAQAIDRLPSAQAVLLDQLWDFSWQRNAQPS